MFPRLTPWAEVYRPDGLVTETGNEDARPLTEP